MARRYKPPEGWTVQGFCFELDATVSQEHMLNRCFGAKRFAQRWAVYQLQGGILAYRMTGISTEAPSFYGLRKRWNQEKHVLAVDRETGEPWWCEVSKEVFNDGIRCAVDGYWNWVDSRSGKRQGAKMGFPKKPKKGKSKDSFTITRADKTQQLVGRGWVHIPKVGQIKTHESTRKLARLVEQGRAEALAVTVSRKGGRVFASVRAVVERPQRQQQPTQPDSRVGVDIGERVLAVVARADGTIVERVENPAPLKAALAELRRLNRQLARRQQGSNRWKETKEELTRLHRKVANIREDEIHKLTTRLTKTHGVSVIEDLNSAGMRKGGGKHLRDAAFGKFKHQMVYKGPWYGSQIVLADRFYPSSKMCSACGTVGDPGNKQVWQCKNEECGTVHDRDENAAINLARWTPDWNSTNRRVDPEQAPVCDGGGTSEAVLKAADLVEAT